MTNSVMPDTQTNAQPTTLNPSPAYAEATTPNPNEEGSPSSLPATVALAPLDLIAPPISSSEVTAIIDAKPLPPSAQPRKYRRNGRVANLPKLERDMVCRMLSNGVPYKQIVAALDEAGFTLSERNISNWATGGYLEWRLEQEQVLQNRLAQDDLLDHLRRENASELPEVGLQAAATRLSQILLQKASRGDDLETNPGAFASQVDLLCRLNRELFALQKYRDEAARRLGHSPARLKRENEEFTAQNEQFYSDPNRFRAASPSLPSAPEPKALPPAQDPSGDTASLASLCR